MNLLCTVLRCLWSKLRCVCSHLIYWLWTGRTWLARFFNLLLILGAGVTIIFYWLTTYTYVVKANTQYVSLKTTDDQMQWSISGYSLCEELDTVDEALFSDSPVTSGCAYILNDQETLRTSKFEVSENVQVNIAFIEDTGIVINLSNKDKVGTLRFFSDSTSAPPREPKILKGKVRLVLDGNRRSHELMLSGTHFETGQLPAIASLSSLKEGVVEAHGARDMLLGSYRYLISSQSLSQGSVVKLINPDPDNQQMPYVKGFMRVASESANSNHFYVHLSPPYKYDDRVQDVAAEVTEFGTDSAKYKPNIFNVIQRDLFLTYVITFLALFLAICAIARALMDLRDIFVEKAFPNKQIESKKSEDAK